MRKAITRVTCGDGVTSNQLIVCPAKHRDLIYSRGKPCVAIIMHECKETNLKAP